MAVILSLVTVNAAAKAPGRAPRRGAGADERTLTGRRLAVEVAAALRAACPPAAPSDPAAWRRCATALADSPVLRAAADESFVWGGQSAAGVYDLSGMHLTNLSPFVWRRMYVSLFMFTGEPVIEQSGDKVVLHLPAQFRNGLDNGDYPYPFWHSQKKWASYQQAKEVILIIAKDKIAGGFRGAETDPTRPVVAKLWDKLWAWDNGAQPAAALYHNLLSAQNPHLAELDASYRELEAALRPHGCLHCHAPNNPANMKTLELLTYPNQALSARHSIVEQLIEMRMPPDVDGNGSGIADAAERERLIEIAKRFEKTAQAALLFEGQEGNDDGSGTK